MFFVRNLICKGFTKPACANRFASVLAAINLKQRAVICCLLFLPVWVNAFSPGSDSAFEFSLEDSGQIPPAINSSFYLTKGSGNVVNGAFHYAIPIYLPPTTNDIAPKLSFTYSSRNATDSHFGVGWQLTGIGAISRFCHRGGAGAKAESTILERRSPVL